MNPSLVFVNKSIQNETVPTKFKKTHSIEMGNYLLIEIPNDSIAIWCRTFDFFLRPKTTFDALNLQNLLIEEFYEEKSEISTL